MSCSAIFDKGLLSKDIWVTSSVAALLKLSELKRTMPTLSSFVAGEAYRGIITGLTEAFQIPKTTIDKLNWDVPSRSLLVPYLQGEGLRAFADAETSTYLLCVKKGLTLDGMAIDPTKKEKPTETEA